MLSNEPSPAETKKDDISFDHPTFKKVLAAKLGVPAKLVKFLVLPAEGQEITIHGIIYRVNYVRENPFRFSAEPVRVSEPESEQHGVME
jgi:hypothetical protein